MESNSLAVSTTAIDGLLILNLPLIGDNRGWFKEHWQREKMLALGLPDFGPVQQNISYNAELGTTRGVHAEPWDKYVSVANGKAFGAWVDLREGPGFGTVVTAELRPDVAVFVPRGVANAFQTLVPETSYMYLVNDHWSAEAEYTFVNLADPTLAIAWPIPLTRAIISDKDRKHPMLSDVAPVKSRETVVIGSDGQLGRALQVALPTEGTRFLTRADIDLTSVDSIENYNWSNVGLIINAAAYTAVDLAESKQGRIDAWRINASAVGSLAQIAKTHRATFVNVSSDYVFDGTVSEHSESEPYSPIGVYGQSKAAGELATVIAPQHYIIRTSWVVGEGNNFVRTMRRLAESGTNPDVIGDQYGRLSFATDLATAILHLVEKKAPYGIYNFSNSGEIMSWFDVATVVFEQLDFDPNRVTKVSTADYVKTSNMNGRTIAGRPQNSSFSLSKIEATGLSPRDARDALAEYLSNDK